VNLAPGKGASVAAKEWQVRSKFLTKGHVRIFSLENEICAVFGGAAELLQPWKDRSKRLGFSAPEM
jgi:hypothetical protein